MIEYATRKRIKSWLTELTGRSGTPTVLVKVVVLDTVDVTGGFCVLVLVIVVVNVDVVSGWRRVLQDTIEG